MPRPVLEVADIFRDHGPAWRKANRGHVSLDQLKVMSAIERCRTAALGGHVSACENAACGHAAIAYNSCRNRHCPKCQGAAARDWLADREAELLPVGYFHLVFTLPKPIADIAFWNKRVLYGLLLQASAETVSTLAADPKHLGARVAVTSVLHTWGSAMTHHPHVHMIVPGGGISLDGRRWIASRPNFFLSVRVLSRLFRRLFLQKLAAAHANEKLRFFNDHAGLVDAAAFAAFLAPLRRCEWVVYSKEPVRRAGSRAGLSRPLHPSRRDLQSPTAPRRRRQRDLPIQRLSARRRRSHQDHAPSDRRVHSPLPHACAAEKLPPHPPLRFAGEWTARRQHRQSPRAAHGRNAPSGAQTDAVGPARPSRRTIASLPPLRRPHDRHRDRRADPTRRLATADRRDRQLMTPRTVDQKSPGNRRQRHRAAGDEISFADRRPHRANASSSFHPPVATPPNPPPGAPAGRVKCAANHLSQ